MLLKKERASSCADLPRPVGRRANASSIDRVGLVGRAFGVGLVRPRRYPWPAYAQTNDPLPSQWT